MKRLYFYCFTLLGICIGFCSQSKAQLILDNNIDVPTMLHDFFDTTCVSIDNITFNGAPISVSFFDASATNLGINAGILMTSGNALLAKGPNTGDISSYYNSFPGDSDLTSLINGETNDACVIEMDIIPSLDTLYFDYVFGSDEYDNYIEWFNDVFAFFVSGPGIIGNQNIAVVPGNNDPVSTFSINCFSSNQEYYVCNNTEGICSSSFNCPQNEDSTTIAYDGFTVPLVARITVIPGETYHVKLAIADAFDDILDSGIFIGIQSLCGDGHLKPFADFIFEVNNNQVQFSNESRYATSFNWDFGDNTFSTEENPLHEYAADGIYNVTLSIHNYCCDMVVEHPVTIGFPTGVSLSDNDQINIFPNPVDGVLNIQLKNGQEGIGKLYNYAGELVSSFNVNGNMTIDVSSFENGILFMQLFVNGKIYLEKVVVK